MTQLVVTAAFGSYANGQTITDPTTVAAILAGPNKIYVVAVADGSGSSGGSGSGGGGSSGGSGGSSSGGGSSSPSLTLTDVDTEIASAFVARGVPANTTVPALITQAIAAQGTGSGVSAAQSLVNSLIFG